MRPSYCLEYTTSGLMNKMRIYYCKECEHTFETEGTSVRCPDCGTPKDGSARLPMDNISLQKRVYGSVTQGVYNEQGDFTSYGKSDFKRKIAERGLVPQN